MVLNLIMEITSMNDNVFAYKKFNNICKNSFEYDQKKSIYENTEIILNQIVTQIMLLPHNFRIYISCHTALRIQYYFDYTIKASTSPKSFIDNLSRLLDEICMYQTYANAGWFLEGSHNSEAINEWELTRMAFNTVWPKTTSGINYDISLNMASLRLEQLIQMFPQIFKDKMSVLDSGCGPARYSVALNKKYPEAKFYCLDAGPEIIEANKNLFKMKNFQFETGLVSNLPYKDEAFDLVMSIGVLHHSDVKLSETIAEHFRVLKSGGALFLFIVGSGSTEMLMWKYLRKLMKNINHNMTMQLYSTILNPMRTQGMIDHCYGEYYETPREELLNLCEKYSSKHYLVPGIPGLDVTKESMTEDQYFDERFGDGQLRYIFIKN